MSPQRFSGYERIPGDVHTEVKTGPLTPPRRRDSHIFAKDPDGHYVEPLWCSARLFAVESFGPPGAAMGILRTAKDAGYHLIGGDIVDRLQRDELNLKGVKFAVRDFLIEPAPKGIVSVVSNPHFKFIREFCERALEVADFKAAMLIPWRRLPHAHWLRRLPLETVYALTPRPSIPTGEYIAAGGKVGEMNKRRICVNCGIFVANCLSPRSCSNTRNPSAPCAVIIIGQTTGGSELLPTDKASAHGGRALDEASAQLQQFEHDLPLKLQTRTDVVVGLLQGDVKGRLERRRPDALIGGFPAALVRSAPRSNAITGFGAR